MVTPKAAAIIKSNPRRDGFALRVAAASSRKKREKIAVNQKEDDEKETPTSQHRGIRERGRRNDVTVLLCVKEQKKREALNFTDSASRPVWPGYYEPRN